MKKLLCLVLSCVMALTVFCCTAAAAEGNVLVSAEVPCTIILSANASATEKYAANTMKQYLSEITGATVPIKDDSTARSGNEIVIGATSRKAFDTSSLKDGGYILESGGGVLYIAGSGTRGNIYGVYGFLEKYCGCHFYTSTVKVIPKQAALTISTPIQYTYRPYFESTETDWRSPHDPEYSLANGLCGGTYRSLSAEQGGTVNYISGFCHTLTTQFCPATTYFESHPEYFALRGGARTRDQLCLTNPDVLKIVTDEVLALLKEKHDPTQALQIVSLTQNDNGYYCTCDKCSALDTANCSHSGSLLTFVNKVAEAVKAAGYTNVAIDTFAYQYTREAPTNVVPDDNVIVRLCSIECCFGHALNDASCPLNVLFMKDLKAWSKICNRLYIWDYVNNFKATLCVFPDFGVLQSNMQTFYENGVKGVYEEGNYYMDACDGEFGELRSYLLSRLMQDPYMDYNAEMNGFLEAYYGSGWENIRKFIDLVDEKSVANAVPLTIFQEPQLTLSGMNETDIKTADALWADAETKAQDSTYLDRVQRSEICWRYWKCCNKKGEFSLLHSTLYERMNRREKLYQDLQKFGVTYLGEPNDTRKLSDCASLYLLRDSTKWSTLFDEKYWDTLEPLVIRLYTFLGKIHSVFNGLL